MVMFFSSLRRISAIFFLAASVTLAAQDGQTATSDDSNWTRIVRASPYWVSQGVFENILTIRRWVLMESGYCASADRHVLYDMRGRFLAWISDGDDREATQRLLNATRKSLYENGKVQDWLAGETGQAGYPFALSCDQPHVNTDEAVARYLGTLPADRIWGAWDDLTFATRGDPESLHDALMYVYDHRKTQNRLTLPQALPQYLAGQILIESGAQTRAHSRADARGILQLSPAALSDCEIAPDNFWHRLAQIDCALRLMNQNARNLAPVFQQRFGHLPEAKRDRLFTLLLVQAYHGGAGRVRALLDDPVLARPAEYFAANHERFTAGDIVFGLVFHNLGRDRLGLASLYYVADVQVATEVLCRTAKLKSTEFCEWNY
jgi:hypothetical protein